MVASVTPGNSARAPAVVGPTGDWHDALASCACPLMCNADNQFYLMDRFVIFLLHVLVAVLAPFVVILLLFMAGIDKFRGRL